LRADPDLPATLVRKGIRRAIEAVDAGVEKLKNGEKSSQPHVDSWSVVYDERSATFNSTHATLSTPNGRVTCEYALPSDGRRADTPVGRCYGSDDFDTSSATLQYDEQADEFDLHVTLKKPEYAGDRTEPHEASHDVDAPENGVVLGVDLNVRARSPSPPRERSSGTQTTSPTSETGRNTVEADSNRSPLVPHTSRVKPSGVALGREAGRRQATSPEGPSVQGRSGAGAGAGEAGVTAGAGGARSAPGQSRTEWFQQVARPGELVTRHDPLDPAAALDVAREAAAAAGDRAMARFRTDLDVRTKEGPLDPVTDADRDAQEAALSVLADAPVDTVVAEEDDVAKHLPETGTAWVVDPIDGTSNFAVGNRWWATAVAYVRDGEPVASVVDLPAIGDTYTAGAEGTTRNGDPVSPSSGEDPRGYSVVPVFGLQRRDRGTFLAVTDAILESFGDVRRYGSGQASLALCAAGEVDGVVSAIHLSPWDTVAGAHLVRQAGGEVTTLAGDRWSYDADGILASNGRRHETLRRRFAEAV
jgi:myo-inositol-1(or 4)-monophosphatase